MIAPKLTAKVPAKATIGGKLKITGNAVVVLRRDARDDRRR
ncbi:hypothetical protein [Actinoplanes solisilvae]|nr:hypothetical protein [Actinoplanes solisilvae]